jgi:phosphate transport system substrate-binding protein
MFKKSLAIAALVAGASVAAAGAAEARDQIRIVGSSTVFPFSTAVAEQFGKTTSFPTPVVESTGSGGGMKLFCAGVGEGHPDITNASRRMKSSEFEKCTEAGVTIVEVKVGYDGIVLANSTSGDNFDLTKEQIFLALAKEVPVDGELVANPYTKWSEIDPSLPDIEIEVLGPPPTSGTRDAFVELAMEGGADENAFMQALEESDEDRWDEVAATIREDGRFIEAGENDNLIVQKLDANPAALGIFGFSFLDQNRDKVQGSSIEGVDPTFDNIAAGDYGISRSLFFYVKKEHVGVIPGIAEYVAEFTSEDAWGPDGYLPEKGLIPLPDDLREQNANNAQNLVPLEGL